jgi:hypothetical protein
MKITEAQSTNPLWQALRAHYTTRLAQLRMDNDNTALSEKETAVLRGRIAECRAILDMDSPEPEAITVQGM